MPETTTHIELTAANGYLIVKMDKKVTETAMGITIGTEDSIPNTTTGEIIAVGPGTRHQSDGEIRGMISQPGQRVMVHPLCSHEIHIPGVNDGHRYLAIVDLDVIAYIS